MIEGVWGNNRVSGYIAVDDLTFFDGDCESKQLFSNQKFRLVFYRVFLFLVLYRSSMIQELLFTIVQYLSWIYSLEPVNTWRRIIEKYAPTHNFTANIFVGKIDSLKNCQITKSM